MEQFFWALGLLYEIIYLRILGNVDLNFRCPRKHLFRERASRSNVGKFDLPMHLMGTLPCVVLAIDKIYSQLAFCYKRFNEAAGHDTSSGLSDCFIDGIRQAVNQ